jgi:hypothetical protein
MRMFLTDEPSYSYSGIPKSAVKHCVVEITLTHLNDHEIAIASQWRVLKYTIPGHSGSKSHAHRKQEIEANGL